MDAHLLGQLYSLMAAFTWAGALVLFKLSGEQVAPLALNLFKNTIGIVLLTATLLLWPGGASTEGFRGDDICILIVSGVIGIALADTVLFHSLNRIGVGILSIVDCLYSPFVILLSAGLLAEALALPQYIGGALILAGVIVCSAHAPPARRSRRQLINGVLLGALAMALIAVGIVMAKPVLEGADFPILWATTIRMVGGNVALLAMVLASPTRRACWAAFRPAAVWKASIPGSVLGTYLSMILWVAGFKLTDASIASILNQTSVVFGLILAAMALKERFTARKGVAVVLAMGGILLVTLGGAY